MGDREEWRRPLLLLLSVHMWESMKMSEMNEMNEMNEWNASSPAAAALSAPAPATTITSTAEPWADYVMWRHELNWNCDVMTL